MRVAIAAAMVVALAASGPGGPQGPAGGSTTLPAGGPAVGSGNSIPHYVPAGGYLAMIETVRTIRGDY